jgi:hypothetical protein
MNNGSGLGLKSSRSLVNEESVNGFNLEQVNARTDESSRSLVNEGYLDYFVNKYRKTSAKKSGGNPSPRQ